MELPRPLNDWAKMHDGVPGISVRQHLLTVACVAEVLLRCYPHLCDRCHIAPSAILFLAARLENCPHTAPSQNLLRQSAEISYR